VSNSFVGGREARSIETDGDGHWLEKQEEKKSVKKRRKKFMRGGKIESVRQKRMVRGGRHHLILDGSKREEGGLRRKGEKIDGRMRL